MPSTENVMDPETVSNPSLRDVSPMDRLALSSENLESAVSELQRRVRSIEKSDSIVVQWVSRKIAKKKAKKQKKKGKKRSGKAKGSNWTVSGRIEVPTPVPLGDAVKAK